MSGRVKAEVCAMMFVSFERSIGTSTASIAGTSGVYQSLKNCHPSMLCDVRILSNSN